VAVVDVEVVGLAVARGFVEAQDGELVMDDTPGGGLTVVFELAIAR
jgi:two-component system sensor histidine kinase KdpD